MAAAAQINDAELAMLDQMYALAQRMIVAVSKTGSSAYTPEVYNFQRGWNANGSLISSLLRKIGSSRSWVKLAEDGRFGPHTSGALWTIIGGGGATVPPTTASGVPVWYAQNRDAVDALVPPMEPPVDSILNQPPPIPNDSGVAQNALQSSNSTLQNLVPVTTPSAPSLPPPQIISTSMSTVPNPVAPPVAEVINAPGSGSDSPAPALTQEELAALQVDTGFEDEPVHVVSTKPQSRVPWYAAAIAAVGLGGAMFYWTRRKKRR